MLPIHKAIWAEFTAPSAIPRVPEPEIMQDPDQVESYVQAYEWGGPVSSLQLYHLEQLSFLIRPGDVVVDLACGPGPLLLELAALYPQTQFVGVDLSPLMLDHLRDTAAKRGLGNVTVLNDNIVTLEKLGNTPVDMFITTSALHHLPDINSLKLVFQRIERLLSKEGGFYIFDFSLLKSRATRQIMIKEVAKLAQPITVIDYEHSLNAAFPQDLVFGFAHECLPRPFFSRTTAFINFFYFLKSADRITAPLEVQEHNRKIWKGLSWNHKVDYLMLKYLQITKNLEPSA